jgi:antirestriction protein ArdC
MTKERFDIHQHITDKIVSAIERGAGDFRLPWHRGTGSIMRPVNIASKKAYRGVNVVALWAYAETSGYCSGTWGTYRQWAEAGAQVRKGEKAAFVVFYKELEVAAETGVEHVHVHTGGQAIVGSVSQSGGGRDNDENRGQPHAPENAGAP